VPHDAPAAAVQPGGRATKAIGDPLERLNLLPLLVLLVLVVLLLSVLLLVLCRLGQVKKTCWQHWQHCCLTGLHVAGHCFLHTNGLK
jgi:predicted ABC-type sugar transport system permease subunit